MMSPELSFQVLIRQVRARDQAAATTLVRELEPKISKTVRLTLTSYQMSHLVDEADICQTVFAAFFQRVTRGQFDLQRPDQLVKLLGTMARNRVLDEMRRHRAIRREGRYVAQLSLDSGLDTVIDTRPAPSDVVAGRELVREIYRRLSKEDRYLAERRSEGCSWEMLGALLGAQPATLRKRLVRAARRVLEDLGLTPIALS